MNSNPLNSCASARFAAAVALCLALLLGVAAQASVESEIRQLVRGADLRSTKVAVVVMDAGTGQTLASINADEPMIPASNMKIVTSAAALDMLGSDFAFDTALELVKPAAGDAVGGVTLLVRGDGDPAFADPKILKAHGTDFEKLIGQWVEAVKKAGVKHVARVVVDDRVFDQQFVHPTWPRDQLNRWYCAQVAGINVNDNCFDIVPAPTVNGRSPRVTILPSAPFVTTRNRAVTADADTFWISRRMGTNELTFFGKVKHHRTEPIPVTMHDSPIVLGRWLADRLVKAGVRVDRVARPDDGEAFGDTRVLHQVRTQIWQVVSRCNKDSQNLFAEAMIKRVGHALTGSSGSWLNGAAAVRTAMRKRLGTTGADIRVADGSGMSRENQVTAKALARLLTSMHNDENLRDAEGRPVFAFSLASAGREGTLRKRMRPLAGRVYAKTGYINGVSCLSGYVFIPHPAGGKPRTIVFSLLFNDIRPPVYVHRVKALQDAIVAMLSQKLTPRQRVGG